ncbi:MAG: 30S ribosomal protein S1 [Spirochaetales bacterium]|nr:30S ribosomal protein S1 [Spirochaetales bacterium]
MLEQSMTEFSSLTPGEQIEAKIVSVTDDTIFLDLGGKSEGVLDAAELRDKSGKITVKTGDTIKAFFLNVQNGEFQFTTRISGEKAGDSLLEEAWKKEIPVEGTVEKEIKGGFQVKIGGTRAFCPYSQMGAKRVDDSSVYIGRTMTFRIQEYSENGRNILVSNRVILEAEKQEQLDALKKKLSEGMKVKGAVKEIRDFGAFVDIGGVQALLPVSEISRKRVNDIHTVLKTGQEVDAVILSIDWARERISISTKELEDDPWDKVKDNYKVGSKYSGTVVRLTNFGAFVSLEPGIDGLLHISDIESEDRINHPREVLKQGQDLEVIINSIEASNRRISLKQASKAPEYEQFEEYFGDDSDTESYNPFSALLKDKENKKK